jgi:hypothetical protein
MTDRRTLEVTVQVDVSSDASTTGQWVVLRATRAAPVSTRVLRLLSNRSHASSCSGSPALSKSS